MTEKKDIEWNEVEDNLKIFEVDENYFIDLGNPFQTEKTEIIKKSVPKLFLVLIFVLILMMGFFFYRGQYFDSVAEISGEWEAKYLVEINCSTDEIIYSLLIEPTTTNLDRPISVKINDKSYEFFEDNEKDFVFEPKEGLIEVVFYCKSLFGKRDIDSAKIEIPFSIDRSENKIKFTKNSLHRLLIYSPEYRGIVFQSIESFSIPKIPAEEIIVVVIDLETGIEYRITYSEVMPHE